MDFLNLWNEFYNGLKGITPILIFLAFTISLLVLLFGNNWLGFISIKFDSYTQGTVYRHWSYQTNPNWYIFIIPLEITSNTETEIIGAELRYRNKKDKKSKLHHSIDGEVDPFATRNFSVPLRKNIAAKKMFTFIFAGVLAEKYYKDLETFSVNNSFGYDCYLRLMYRKNGKRKFTKLKKVKFCPLQDYVYISGGKVERINEEEYINQNK